jgi:HemY protein
MTFFRVLWFVVKLGILIAVAVYLANRPGNLSLVWFGYRTDLHPIALSLIGVLLCLGVLYVVGRIIARVVAVPGDIGAMRGAAREAKGYQVLTRGLAAAAAGDAREAKRLSVMARKLLAQRGKEPPITRLLAAQAAQLEGDETAAHAHFKALAETPETAILGLRGLALSALKEGNETEARRLAERALAANPHAQWAAETALRLQAKAGRFDSADESLKAAPMSRATSPSVRRAKR